MKRRWLRVLIVAAALAAATSLTPLAPDAAACPVCYGEGEGSTFTAAKLSVVFLGGLVYVLFGGAAAVVVALRRRVRADLVSAPPTEPAGSV